MNGDEAIYCNLMVVFIVVMKNCHVDGDVHVGDSWRQLIWWLGDGDGIKSCCFLVQPTRLKLSCKKKLETPDWSVHGGWIALGYQQQGWESYALWQRLDWCYIYIYTYIIIKCKYIGKENNFWPTTSSSGHYQFNWEGMIANIICLIYSAIFYIYIYMYSYQHE